MLKNFFRLAWRNLRRNKSFSLINLLGLSVGMSCTILIGLWVVDEWQYDRFQPNYDRVQQLMANRDFDNQVMTDANMVLPFAFEMKEKLPSVAYATVTSNQESHVLSMEDKKLSFQGYSASSDFFVVFPDRFLRGNREEVLRSPNNIVISQSTANAIFGDDNPIGRTLHYDQHRELNVAGVTEDLPANSSMQYDFIVPFDQSDPYYKKSMGEWTSSSWLIYLLPKEGTDLGMLQKEINEVKYKHDPKDATISHYFLFPMNRWRLFSDFENGVNTGGMIRYVRLFTLIAIIVLLTACINFMNLSTARSAKRAREVGVRKTLGSNRQSLLLQFFAESLLLSLLALILALIIVVATLPAFNLMVEKQLSVPFNASYFWMLCGCVLLFTTVIAGSYPALYLSSFNPIRVLKGKGSPGARALLPRRILVVAQFVISIVLISAAVMVHRQIQSVKDRPIGYNPDNLLLLSSSEDIQRNFDAIRNDLQGTGQVASVTRTFSPVTSIWWRTPAPDWKGKPTDMNLIFSGMNVGTDFTKTIGVSMLAGHDFLGTPADSAAIILNKAAVEVMGFSPEQAIGMQLKYGRTFTVVGVTDNIVMDSPFKPVDPMMTFYNPAQTYSVAIRLRAGADPKIALSAIEPILHQYNPSVPFDYQFADADFSQKFLREELIRQISTLFTSLALLICVMGLAGLVAYAVETRIREISVRRVLGASITQILRLLSTEFIGLLLLSFCIAIPIAWWSLQRWLNSYTYHVNVQPLLFLAIAVFLSGLTLAVVFSSTIHRLLENPVKALRSE